MRLRIGASAWRRPCARHARACLSCRNHGGHDVGHESPSNLIGIEPATAGLTACRRGGQTASTCTMLGDAATQWAASHKWACSAAPGHIARGIGGNGQILPLWGPWSGPRRTHSSQCVADDREPDRSHTELTLAHCDWSRRTEFVRMQRDTAARPRTWHA